MKNLKSILILSLLAVALLLANLSAWHGGGEIKASGRRALVEGVENLLSVRLKRKGAPAVELGRKEGVWRLRAPYAGSVDEQVVMRFLDGLVTAPITDVISDSALLKLGRTRADFSLDDPLLKVVLADEGGVRDEVWFGTMTPLSDGVFASVAGMDSVFVVSSNILAAVDIDAERLRRRALFSIGPDAVSSFGIKQKSKAPLEFARSDSEWKVGDMPVSGQKVRDFLARLTSAEALEFVWPVGASNETEHASAALLVGYGLDPDSAVTVTVKGVDGEDRRISLGRPDDRGHVYALVHGGTAIATVPAKLRELAEQDEGGFADSRLFPVETASVVRFSVSDKDVQYALVREKAGGWTIESPIVAKADDAAVEAMLSRIVTLSSSDLVGPEEGVAVSVTTNAEKLVVSRTGVFGRSAPEDLRSREIVRIDPARVKRLVRIGSRGAAETTAVVYDRERKAWNVEGGAVEGVADVRGVTAVLSAVNPLVCSRVVRLKVLAADLDDYGLDTPFLTVAIDQDVDGAIRRNLILGKKAGGGRFATLGSSDAVFVIGDEQVELLSSAIVGK